MKKADKLIILDTLKLMLKWYDDKHWIFNYSMCVTLSHLVSNNRISNEIASKTKYYIFLNKPKPKSIVGKTMGTDINRSYWWDKNKIEPRYKFITYLIEKLTKDIAKYKH